MGTLPRCLCLILTIWMAGSRPSAGLRNGSPESDRWWGTKDAQRIRSVIAQARASGDFSTLEQAAAEGSTLALRRNARLPAVRYLINLGGARIARFRYRAALEALSRARDLAESIGDREDAAAAALNLSSLYLEMSDAESALHYAEMARSESRGLRHPYFEHHLLGQLGKLYSLAGDRRAEAAFQNEIEAARAHGDLKEEARAWELLAGEWIKGRRLVDAERAFTEALRLRRLFYPADLPYSYADFGKLRLKQGSLREALHFTQLALDAENQIESTLPEFLLMHQRGEIFLALGQGSAALRDFRTAVNLAGQWRHEALPAVATLTATDVTLQKQVFQSFIETAAHQALREDDQALTNASFQALEENRAASLREALAMGEWRKKLPSRYSDVLAELRSEQVRRRGAGVHRNPEFERTRSELTGMEAETGIQAPENKVENFLSRESLTHFQRVLSTTDLFLSFHLGDSESYLWTVTRDAVRLHRLAPAARIRGAVQEFRQAVQAGAAGTTEAGIRLYDLLFGSLRPQDGGRRDWIMSGEDVLFEAPLAAVVEGKGSALKYLVERHSLRMVPGAWTLTPVRPMQAGGWLGVGDPIYNRADSRWLGQRAYLGWFASASTPVELSRLVGSDDELRASARSWGGNTVLLEGLDATREKFQAAIAAQPSVIHLATHVVTPAEQPEQALIAFGIDRSGEPQFLSTADVAAMHVPGAIVAMTGCSTGAGEIREGAGLLGLTRAWQLAGARAVIATLWPVEDSQGELFTDFYRYLRRTSAAEALRRSQMDMIASGTWRSSPRYWASYQLTGGEE